MAGRIAAGQSGSATGKPAQPSEKSSDTAEITMSQPLAPGSEAFKRQTTEEFRRRLLASGLKCRRGRVDVVSDC